MALYIEGNCLRMLAHAAVPLSRERQNLVRVENGYE